MPACVRASDPTFREEGSLLFHGPSPKPGLTPAPSFFPPPLLPLSLPSLLSRTPLHRPPRRRLAAAPTPPQQLLPAALRPPARCPSSEGPQRRCRQPRARGARPAPGSGAGGCRGGRRGRGHRRDAGAAARGTSCAPGKLPGCLVRFAGWGSRVRRGGGGAGRDRVGDARGWLLCAPRASLPHPAGLVPVQLAWGRVQARGGSLWRCVS